LAICRRSAEAARGDHPGVPQDRGEEQWCLPAALDQGQHTGGRPARTDDKRVDGNALHETAQLFRTFGEDYHERTLEEAHIFPAVRKAGGLAAGYVNVLKDQHARGRAITDYILSVTGNGSISTGNAEPLARALETFQIMYANHAAREDTIVFPAWKSALSEHDLDEMGDKFEDIEKQMFGKDGFEDAVGRIGRIEKSLGLSDLAQFTAPLPPATGTP
jgi:hemerythrin-like domain-containing protein